MALSQNGYAANDRSAIVSYPVPGGKLALRRGPAGELLAAAVTRWHNEVEPLVWPGTWGYAERTIRGSETVLSNHASGTAADCCAPAHPLGTDPAKNFTPAKIAAVRRIVADSDGCLRWGGDYTGRKDGMHLEVVKDEAHCAAVLARWRGGTLRFPVIGQIRQCYDRVGGPALLGQPKGPEVPTNDPAGRWQQFDRGRILWHPLSGAHELHGDIEARWLALGYERTFGWPTTDEAPCPDGQGRFVHFTYGPDVRSIYWTRGTGAHPVGGGIRALWASTGWERGPLGYPTGEETPAADGHITQAFQRGTVRWDLRAGRGEVLPR